MRRASPLLALLAALVGCMDSSSSHSQRAETFERMVQWNEEQLSLCIDGWGAERMGDMQAAEAIRSDLMRSIAASIEWALKHRDGVTRDDAALAPLTNEDGYVTPRDEASL